MTADPLLLTLLTLCGLSALSLLALFLAIAIGHKRTLRRLSAGERRKP